MKYAFATLALLIFLAACTQQSTTTTLPPTTVTGPATSKVASVSVSDQPIVNSGVTIPSVKSIGPGWIAIHVDNNGAPGTVIGKTVVSDGENTNVKVAIDATKATSTLYAMLHIDAGVIGTYEFPGDDVPATQDGKMVNVAFKSSGTPASTAVTTTLAGTKTIEISSAGFSPKTLTIKAGDKVTFVNKDSAAHWPASTAHPTHTVYPGSDISKCGTAAASSIFDACKGLAQNEEWSFTFTQKGSWNYHDHLNSALWGTVVVE